MNLLPLVASGGTNTPTYVDDVFSTYLYTGNGSTQTINNGIALGNTTGGYAEFVASNRALTLASNSAFAFGTGDFTVEAWVYHSTDNTYPTLLEIGNHISGGIAFLARTSGGNAQMYAGAFYGSKATTLNAWNHIAWVRSSGVFNIYVNGVGGTGVAFTNNLTDTSTVTIGQISTLSASYNLVGRVSSLRVVKGTAVYTSNFTPSTLGQLTAISGTSLLCCNTPSIFTDYSTNGFTITQVGGPSSSTSGGPFNDGAGKGGMVWLKGRYVVFGATDHAIYDTARGATFDLVSNTTAAATTQSTGLNTFNSNGFSLGALTKLNTNADTYASWTFRKAAKFFDVVTWTGNATNRTISHSLGAVPGMIIVKRTDTTSDWQVYHRSLANTEYAVLNSTAAKATGATRWNSTTPTSSVFSVGTDITVNASGGTYVAYLFAHDVAADGWIQCGTFTNVSGNATVNLGWEPQYILVKRTSGDADWYVNDSARAMPVVTATGKYLSPNLSSAENTGGFILPTATGFISDVNAFGSGDNNTYIYLAIRRPNKPPTVGTQVYNGSTSTATSGVLTSGFATDMVMTLNTSGSTSLPFSRGVLDRLRGAFNNLPTSATSVESNNTSTISFDQSNGIKLNAGGVYSAGYFYPQFKRAPGVFDVVCWSGDVVTPSRTLSHNLGVAAELVITKSRNLANQWVTFSSILAGTEVLLLNDTLAKHTQNSGASYSSSNSAITLPVSGSGNSGAYNLNLNLSAYTYVAYLFATKVGISKCGSYTGNGSSLTINAGFTTGARFILIKRTDSTGDWYVWDTARGIVAGNDPHLSLNTDVADVTTDDSIDPDTTGFIVNQVAATNINVNAATYIYLAFA